MRRAPILALLAAALSACSAAQTPQPVGQTQPAGASQAAGQSQAPVTERAAARRGRP